MELTEKQRQHGNAIANVRLWRTDNVTQWSDERLHQWLIDNGKAWHERYGWVERRFVNLDIMDEAQKVVDDRQSL